MTRIRLSNPFGYAPIVMDHVSMASAEVDSPRLRGPQSPVQVNGEHRIVIHPGESVTSDPVPFAAVGGTTVAVTASFETPTEVSAHRFANRLAWTRPLQSRPHGSDPDAGFRPFGSSWAWIDAIEVLTTEVDGAVVALGDSITDGAGADFGEDVRWTDVLADRMRELPVGDVRRRAVVSAGIGGNTVGGSGSIGCGVNALARLERDVLSLAGVREVIVFEGTNDLHSGRNHGELIDDLSLLARRIRGAGKRVIIATLIPRVGGYLWTPAHEHERLAANEWIRTQTECDGVLDFELVASSADAAVIASEFDADGTHLNTAGYRALGDSIDLGIFAA